MASMVLLNSTCVLPQVFTNLNPWRSSYMEYAMYSYGSCVHNITYMYLYLHLNNNNYNNTGISLIIHVTGPLEHYYLRIRLFVLWMKWEHTLHSQSLYNAKFTCVKLNSQLSSVLCTYWFGKSNEWAINMFIRAPWILHDF